MSFHESEKRKVVMTIKRWHLLVSGKVQGVSYRAYTEQKAADLGLTGVVRNLPDGRVEIIAEGSEAELQALQDWCFSGPPLAVVEDVVKETQTATGEFTRFRVVNE